MLCRGVVQEARGPKSCWLPAERGSQFQLCRRCHFYKVTDILDQLTRSYEAGKLHPPYELLLNETSFLNELLHPAREQALLNLLSSLYRKNRIQFLHVMTKLAEKSVFSILITNRIVTHSPGSRCEMYRMVLKETALFTGDRLCTRCWPCLAWMARQHDPRLQQLLRSGFGFVLWKLTPELYATIGDPVLLDLCSSFGIRGNAHSLHLFLTSCLAILPFDEVLRFCLCLAKESWMFPLLFPPSLDQWFPDPLRDDVILRRLQRSAYQSMKQKTDQYKEDLMIKTWHPDRLFSWCFDLEELADFKD